MNSVALMFQQVGLKDIIDILIVALLIYQGLLIIHGTRAVQMLIGVFLLVLLFWIGHVFKLYSLNWLLEHFFDSFFIIGIIIFQDQFRSALASFGTGQKFFKFLNKHQIEIEIEEVVEVVSAMSKEKIGALIVIENNQGLANFVETGTKLDCEVHSDIIYAIFQSNSSLHDGALILSNGKITAAGCFLPLSKNKELEKHLGTRHRAALGISEDTDAWAITVSEETGAVNLCVDGEFYLCENMKKLRQYLKFLWGKEKLSDNLTPIRIKGRTL